MYGKKLLLLFTFCALLATSFLIGCTTIYNPATGKKETFFINTATEVGIGKWAHLIYRPLAMYFQAVKDRASEQVPAGELSPAD